ncbi:MAG: GxxExxY protein [Acidobacteriia bacterium]|nr:GxxExxY protein [Terriglobia bacterium]
METNLITETSPLTGQIIGLAMRVHSAIGPGVLESVYRTCLRYEIEKAGFEVQSELSLPVRYEGMTLQSGYRVDLMIEKRVIVELKCVETILPIHKAQLMTYLRLANLPLGLLLNFNVVYLREGISRVLNSKYRP